jgi:precorrin-6Y C5,15-methyltransferase (decarboxylating)
VHDVSVIGVPGERFAEIPAEAIEALRRATVIAGGRRLVAAWDAFSPGHRHQVIEIAGDVTGAVARVAEAAHSDADVAVLASGDPGFFGILRSLLQVMDRSRLHVFAAPSSVAIAFSRLAIPWDDAVVVSAHGRSLEEAVQVVRMARKVAILSSPDNPPEVLARALLAGGARVDLAAVCCRLGSADEEVAEMSLTQMARGRWDPLSVVVLVGPGGLPLVGWGPGRQLAWGLTDDSFAHRAGMVTKAEVRAVALGKLALPPVGVVWDVGAGSGSVAIECARLCPGLSVFAVEQHPEDARRISINASAHAASVHVFEGHAPDVLVRLPEPDRVFVGGGGIAVLDACLARLAPGGVLVATFSALDRAAAAVERLGQMVQIGVDRAVKLPDGGWRMAAENPVFLAWGPMREEELHTR